MISKNELKYIQSLYHKKARDKENAFIVEGPKMVEELLHSTFTVKKIWSVPGLWLENHPDLDTEPITDAELHKASHLNTPNQVIAVVRPNPLPVELPNVRQKLVLMLDGIQDPGNFGTLIRIADWFGVDFIVASKDCADCYNPKVVQSTMGSIFRIPVYYTDLPEYLANQTVPVPIYGALLNGKPLGEALNQAPFQSGVLIIGNESKGIRAALLPLITTAIRIPAFGKAESLNAAVAAGILLSHLKLPMSAAPPSS
ncbi:MAG TPA: RNA methyltransferase [Arachidicoccus sp.]|nr:RNA methyltransferase [Arachidicoccus sp.]